PLPQGYHPGLHDDLGLVSMQFTKDGKYLGVLSDHPHTELWRFPLDGGAPQEMLHDANFPKVIPAMSWFHEDSLIWSGALVGDRHVIMRDLRRGTDREVTLGAAQERYAAVSPDGAHFAYSTSRNQYYEIWLRNRADGSERRIVSARDFAAG